MRYYQQMVFNIEENYEPKIRNFQNKKNFWCNKK